MLKSCTTQFIFPALLSFKSINSKACFILFLRQYLTTIPLPATPVTEVNVPCSNRLFKFKIGLEPITIFQPEKHFIRPPKIAQMFCVNKMSFLRSRHYTSHNATLCAVRSATACVEEHRHPVDDYNCTPTMLLRCTHFKILVIIKTRSGLKIRKQNRISRHHFPAHS